MMRTWSIESVLRGLERITRPPRRTGGFDEDAAGESSATCRAPDPSDCLSCGASVCRWPADVDVRLVGFTSCGQDMESYATGFNEGFAEAQRQQDPDWQPDDDTPNPTPFECIACGARYSKSGDHDCPTLGYNPAEHVPGMHTPTDRLCVYTSANGIDTAAICGVCRPVRAIVEQMIEERFGGQSERADTQDAQMWRAFVSPEPDQSVFRSGGQTKQYGPRPRIATDSPAASTAGDSAGEASGPSPVSPSPARSDKPSVKFAECSARHGIWCCTKPPGHVGKHGQAGVFWYGAKGLIALFDAFITKWVPESSQGHLLDNDDNDGERMRRAIREALAAPK